MKVKQVKQEILDKVLVPGNRVFEECVAFNPIIDGSGNTRDGIYFPRSIYGNPTKGSTKRKSIKIIARREEGENSFLSNSFTSSTYMRMVLDDLAVLSAADSTGAGIFDFIPEYIVPLNKQRWIECCDKCDVRDPIERGKSYISLDLYSTTLKMYIEVDGRCHDVLEQSKSDQARKMYMEEEHSISELRLKYYASGKAMHYRKEVVGEKRDSAREDLRRILSRRWEIGKEYLDKIPDPHKNYGHYMLDSFMIGALEFGESALKGYEFYTESPKRTVNQAVSMVVEYLGRKKMMAEKCRKRLAQEIRFINRLIKGKNR
jgi:hypothetical protein